MTKTDEKTTEKAQAVAVDTREDATPDGYYARADGWIGGRRVRKGDRVTLTAREARYENVATQPPKDTRRK